MTISLAMDLWLREIFSFLNQQHHKPGTRASFMNLHLLVLVCFL